MPYFTPKPWPIAICSALVLHAAALWALHAGVQWREAAPPRIETVARLISAPKPAPQAAPAAVALAQTIAPAAPPAPQPAEPLKKTSQAKPLPAPAPAPAQAAAPVSPIPGDTREQPSAVPAASSASTAAAPSPTAEPAPPRSSTARVGTPAVATYQAQPLITQMMQSLGEDKGDVTLKLLISKTGDVLEVRPVKMSEHERLNRAVLAAAKRSQYAPAECDGEPVPSWWGVTYRIGFSGTAGEPSGTVDCKNLPLQ
jgi:periplasmic protein TonB